MKSSASESKPFQSRSIAEIPGREIALILWLAKNTRAGTTL